MRIAVAGAGVFGLTAALELARRGHRVEVVDPGPVPHPAASSTDVSKLVRMDYGADAGLTELASRALDGWEAWNRRWGEQLFHPEGLLVLTPAPMPADGFEGESLRLLAGRGVPLERLDREALVRRFPAWAESSFGDGYFNPRAGWAESARVVARLAAEAARTGVRLRQGERVAGLAERGSRVAGVRLAGGDELAADRVVVAAGAWTAVLLPWLADRLRPVGQPVLLFRPADPSPFAVPRFPPWAADVTRTGRYGFPALADGTVKVGHHGPGRVVDPAAVHGGKGAVTAGEEAAGRAWLAAELPALAAAPLAAGRLCLYCDSFDGDFWIGRDPDREGLVVAAGGSGHGFKFAPVLGGLIADAVEGRDGGPLAARFGWRLLGETQSDVARAGRADR